MVRRRCDNSTCSFEGMSKSSTHMQGNTISSWFCNAANPPLHIFLRSITTMTIMKMAMTTTATMTMVKMVMAMTTIMMTTMMKMVMTTTMLITRRRYIKGQGKVTRPLMATIYTSTLSFPAQVWYTRCSYNGDYIQVSSKSTTVARLSASCSVGWISPRPQVSLDEPSRALSSLELSSASAGIPPLLSEGSENKSR